MDMTSKKIDLKSTPVGPQFDEEKLVEAQKLSWQALRATSMRVHAGMTEKETSVILRAELKAAGYQKMWHPPQIRFGSNTQVPFGKSSTPDLKLKENDIFFLDIGPIFNGYEGDVGETYVLGEDPEMHRIQRASKTVFDKTREFWKKSGSTGRDLYQYAESVAKELDCRLSLQGASGHRVADFPHGAFDRRKLHSLSAEPEANRWILEIHVFHPGLPIAAFYEDML